MEVILNKKIDEYFVKLTNDMSKYITENSIDDTNKNNIINILNNYPKLIVDKFDFQKRKRVKNQVPLCIKCNACRANGEQCSRKRREGELYCGTHEKNRPHGVINTPEKNDMKKVEVWLQDIKGIMQYIDDNGNVYKTQDIICNKINPEVIYKYRIDDNKYILENLV